MDWNNAKDLILEFLAAGAIYLIINEVHSLRKSVETLNTTIAAILERSHIHTEAISKLENRVARFK